MPRVLCLILLVMIVGLTGCWRKTVRYNPDGDIESIEYSDHAPEGTCYRMTLTPAIQVMVGGYASPEAVCFVFRTARPETQPLFHLENPSTSDHLYTARPTEIREAAEWNYTFRDTCCYVYETPAPNRLPLYRLSKRGTWCHFYTTAESERDSLVSIHGFTAEGVACYVPRDSVGGAAVLYRIRKVPYPD